MSSPELSQSHYSLMPHTGGGCLMMQIVAEQKTCTYRLFSLNSSHNISVYIRNISAGPVSFSYCCHVRKTAKLTTVVSEH